MLEQNYSPHCQETEVPQSFSKASPAPNDLKTSHYDSPLKSPLLPNGTLGNNSLDIWDFLELSRSKLQQYVCIYAGYFWAVRLSSLQLFWCVLFVLWNLQI
jgi:hypothetical protein